MDCHAVRSSRQAGGLQNSDLACRLAAAMRLKPLSDKGFPGHLRGHLHGTFCESSPGEAWIQENRELSGVIRTNRKSESFLRIGLTRYKNRGFNCEWFGRIDSRESRCESPVPLRQGKSTFVGTRGVVFLRAFFCGRILFPFALCGPNTKGICNGIDYVRKTFLRRARVNLLKMKKPQKLFSRPDEGHEEPRTSHEKTTD